MVDNLLARLTARLASTARLDEIVDTVIDQIVELGFGAVWMAAYDEASEQLVTLKEVIDGVDTTHQVPRLLPVDPRHPIGHGFREKRIVNIPDPRTLVILEPGDEDVPPERMAVGRAFYDHLRGHPFASGPLLGSRGQPVGAIGLASYRGDQPIPEDAFHDGLLRAFMDHLGIAMERAASFAKLEQLNADLVKAQATIARDARIKAVGELAAAVAHDLNNLAGVALMTISVCERAPAETPVLLPRIARANRAIGELVARLQRVARTGSIDTDEPARVHQIVEDVLALIGPVLREQAIVLQLSLPQVPAVAVDPTLLHQIALNLILNAQDALAAVEPGTRRISVTLRDDPDAVRLIVADSGPGIEPRVLVQLFDPFVTTKTGHVGLGLAAARASLKHFGGRIEGWNGDAGGAVFEVTLPRAKRLVARTPPRPTPIGLVPPPRRRGTILVADDDPDIMSVIHAFLEPLAYSVVVAVDADQALALAKKERFDLVLCDVGMPKRSGLEICQILRDDGYRGKIVLMTGWERSSVEADGRASGCDSILTKPFLGEDLLRVVDRVLSS